MSKRVLALHQLGLARVRRGVRPSLGPEVEGYLGAWMRRGAEWRICLHPEVPRDAGQDSRVWLWLTTQQALLDASARLSKQPLPLILGEALVNRDPGTPPAST